MSKMSCFHCFISDPNFINYPLSQLVHKIGVLLHDFFTIVLCFTHVNQKWFIRVLKLMGGLGLHKYLFFCCLLVQRELLVETRSFSWYEPSIYIMVWKVKTLKFMWNFSVLRQRKSITISCYWRTDWRLNSRVRFSLHFLYTFSFEQFSIRRKKRKLYSFLSVAFLFSLSSVFLFLLEKYSPQCHWEMREFGKLESRWVRVM